MEQAAQFPEKPEQSVMPDANTMDQPLSPSQWNSITQHLRAEFGEDLFSSWFARMEPENFDNAVLTLSVPTKFLRNWIETHYLSRLMRICAGQLGPLKAVAVKVRTRGLPQHARDIAHKPAGANDRCGASAGARTGPERGSPLDPALTFASFVQGKSNALAHAAARRVAEATPGAPVNFNPLVIHSAAGLGKTHLLNAIAWHIRQQHLERKVMFISAERFMYHFLAALKKRDVLSFKDEFQNIDVLLIDDFQFLQGKTMQQEFCHTFNSLVDQRRQVIIAADVPPSQLDSIDQRMRSRLAGGLVVDIDLPEIDLRRNIIRVRLADACRRDPRLVVDDEVVEFIANRIAGGGRELEGALNRVIATHQVTGAAINVDLAALALRDLTEVAETVRVRIDDILRIVGRHYNVARADLLSPRRARSIVRPRQIGMYLAKKLTSRSLPEIGRRFGGRDHSTVLHAVRKVEKLLSEDERLTREINLLIRLLEQR